MIPLRHVANGVAVWTVGHSSRSAGELQDVLRAFAVELIADVRRRPASRRHPHFTREALSRSLGEAGIGYLGLPELGGFRGKAGSGRHAALKAPAFRAYADHMAGEGFRDAMTTLLARAGAMRTAVLCAERDWRGCHRSLIADYLHACGARVIHIDGPGPGEDHVLTDGACVADGGLDYAGAQRSLL